MSEIDISEYRLTDEERECVISDGVRKPKDLMHSALKKLRRIQDLLEDKEYIAKVESLVPRAEIVVRKIMQRNETAVWNREFHREMNRLKREAGLIR